MKKLVIFIFLFQSLQSQAQDPHFSQYFSSPLSINPAMTGNTDADWRVATVYRTQWQQLAAPYSTATVSYDQRIFKEQTGGSIFGIGGMFMHDASFYKILKGNYASLNLAYHQQLDDDAFHHLGLGFGATYGQRRINFKELTWEEQFTSNGFNTNLPSGETGLSNMKAYLSLNTGLLYTVDNYTTHFEMGASIYHLNKPKQTFLQDENQTVPARYVFHTGFDRLINDYWFVNLNAMFQQQSALNYWMTGASIGHFLGEDESTHLSVGAWYRFGDSFFPYVSIYRNGWQFGLSYDVTASNIGQMGRKPQSFEISLSFRRKTGDPTDAKTRCPGAAR